MGVDEYGIFDPSQVYQRPRKEVAVTTSTDSSDNKPKKYHVGYIAGVFDLFHVGHLEKFKLAKEQCDHLIVGLVSDEGVEKYKKTKPFIPFEERKAILEACRYVDEVVKLPLDYAGTREAWKMYGFDVQFSGSDYVEDSYWLKEKEFLEQHGVDLVFFPYTESTSSSKLKALIEEKLI
ncbi:MAG: adenylyltransferase/cytidyltransferase family protein [Lachnospiraceae bacterium]|nr:adenylyltransferase/cytidyltransferase family protein [Lachnospiraceae bacterium]